MSSDGRKADVWGAKIGAAIVAIADVVVGGKGLARFERLGGYCVVKGATDVALAALCSPFMAIKEERDACAGSPVESSLSKSTCSF